MQNKFRDGKSLQVLAHLSALSFQIVMLYNTTIWSQVFLFLDTESASKQTTKKLVFHQAFFRTGANIGVSKLRSAGRKT
jgi:hypothetical protein